MIFFPSLLAIPYHFSHLLRVLLDTTPVELYFCRHLYTSFSAIFLLCSNNQLLLFNNVSLILWFTASLLLCIVLMLEFSLGCDRMCACAIYRSIALFTPCLDIHHDRSSPPFLSLLLLALWANGLSCR